MRIVSSSESDHRYYGQTHGLADATLHIALQETAITKKILATTV